MNWDSAFGMRRAFCARFCRRTVVLIYHAARGFELLYAGLVRLGAQAVRRVLNLFGTPAPNFINADSKQINMYPQIFQKAIAAFAVLFSLGVGPLALVKNSSASVTITNAGEKDIFLPDDIDQVPRGNDFNNPDSEYSFKHSKTTPNFILFWDKEYGDDPMTNAIVNRRFDVDGILKEADRFYDYYVNTMKWVNKDTSYATKHKFIFIVFPSPAQGTGTAFGGAVDNGKIGAFWTPATRINRGPYGVVAHELGHSFQAMSRADGAASFTGGGGIAEMTSQWMLWQVYPEWMTFENYHLVAFMKATAPGLSP